MKLAPSKENVELLRTVSNGLDQIANRAMQNAMHFKSQVSACMSELTDGDEESLKEIVQTVTKDAQKTETVARELAKEANLLADDLEQEIKVKTLRR